MAKHELPAKDKATHAEVKYERPSEHSGKSCGDCEHLVDALTPRCMTVKDPIYLNGYCVRFEAVK